MRKANHLRIGSVPLPRILLAATLAILPTILGAETLADRLARVVDEHPASKRANVGVCVVDAKTGEAIFARNEDRLFTPASNTKLYTSAFALATWGKDKTFETSIADWNTPYSGRMDGDIALMGDGDPVFDSKTLQAMIGEYVRQRELKTVCGRFHYYKSDLSWPWVRPKGPGWMWDDDPDPYSMSIAPIMMDYNVGKIDWTPKACLEPPSDSPAIIVENHLSGDESPKAFRRPMEDAIIVRSLEKAAPTVPVSLSILDPVAWIESVARKSIIATGVTFDSSCDETWHYYSQPPMPIVSHTSPPLSEILARFMKPSENAIGEMLFLNLAEHLGGAWDWPDAEKAERAWLEQTVGLAPDEFRLVDGSGLSRYNLVTAAGTVKLLRFMHAHPEFDVFDASLPVAGVDGTLASRMKGTPAANVVHAKTGTMSGISCLSGYAPAADGCTLAFSILVNGYVGSSAPARDLQDKLCVALVTPADPAPRVAFAVE